MTKTHNDSLNDILDGIYSQTLVEKPCKIVNVNSQYSVDVEYYDNNTADMLYNVPVKHIQSSCAYVFLGLNKGDRGTVRFFDNTVSEYINSSKQSVTPQRKHSINDNIFSCGFYPAKEQYAFPQGDIVIGTTSGAMINMSSDTITISGTDITINAANITLGENTTIDGKVFLEHTHSNGNSGNPTGKVI